MSVPHAIGHGCTFQMNDRHVEVLRSSKNYKLLVHKNTAFPWTACLLTLPRLQDEDRKGDLKKSEQPARHSQIILLLVTSVIQTFGETVA